MRKVSPVYFLLQINKVFQKFVPVCFLLTFHHLFKLILENINNFGKGTTYTNGTKNYGKTQTIKIAIGNNCNKFSASIIDKILTINLFVEKINKFKNFRNTLYMNVSLFC